MSNQTTLTDDHLGFLFRSLREELDWTVGHMSRATGLSVVEVSDVELRRESYDAHRVMMVDALRERWRVVHPGWCLSYDEGDMKPNTKKLNEQVDAWNASNPSGTDVILTDDFGKEEKTKTRSEAWVLGGHTSVVMVNGRTGGYLLDRIRPVTE